MINPFNYFCAQILPLVYDDTLSYYECLCKVTAKLNEVIKQSNMTTENMTALKTYVDNYFNDLNVQQMVDTAINDLINNGEFAKIVVNEVTPLQTNFKTDNFIFIGDSYAFYPDENTSWLAIFKNLAKLTSDQYYNFCVRGSGFTQSVKWVDILNQNLDKVKNKKTITKFVIVGGHNDYGKTTEITVEATKLLNIVRQNFPNAEIHLFAVGNDLNYTKRVGIKTAYQYYAQLENIGYIYHPIYNLMHFTGHYDSGGVHPNAIGSTAIGNMIYQSFTSTHPVVPITANALGQNNNVTYTQMCDGLNVEVDTPYMILTDIAPLNINIAYQTLNATVGNWGLLPVPQNTYPNIFNPVVNMVCIGKENSASGGNDKTLVGKLYVNNADNSLECCIYGISQSYEKLRILPHVLHISDII